MNPATIEIYHPRRVSNLGQWDIGGLKLKVYGLVAHGKRVDDLMQALAQSFVREDVLARVADEGHDNGMGFVIIHPGELGVSISAHWWIQGSVLCQHIYRKLYAAIEPMDTVKRPVIACVWELALINAEQEAWRKTMMKSAPSPSAYMHARADFEAA
ncbi:hypothetical protein [Mesorhizobium comanense]|uniref:hypothetical protein n=1 Tax=Mesorhizobium comanense TaxID=2502215 RepID=UPI0010F6A938|nr:hypothetical protein [Mesorhizobium comanense]DAV95933.1 MAG TPA: hypothetical protein [Microviridae sp.]